MNFVSTGPHPDSSNGDVYNGDETYFLKGFVVNCVAKCHFSC